MARSGSTCSTDCRPWSRRACCDGATIRTVSPASGCSRRSANTRSTRSVMMCRRRVARTQILRYAYWTYAFLGEYDKAEQVAEERMRIARASGDARLIAGALSSLADAALGRGEFNREVELQRESVAVARQNADPASLA